METAAIFDVKHFAIHYGPGIRTTFFLMGCPLRCLWCQNPESQKNEPLLMFTRIKCIGCGNCAAACGKLDDLLQLPRSACTLCGACIRACPTGAKQFVAEHYTPTDILAAVQAETVFFDESGGGVTFSGGECLTHAVFLEEACRILQENGIHTAIDTCGAVPWSSIERVLPYADLFLYDIKKMDPVLHKAYTGIDNTQILNNLKRLTHADAKLIIRVPLIPGYTDSQDDIRQIGLFLRDELQLKIERCELLPYNKLAASKYGNKTGWSDYTIGTYRLPELEPQSKDELAALCNLLSSFGVNAYAESL